MLRVSYVFAIVVALAATAHADTSSRDKALQLFEESNKAYKSGKFEDAAELLRKAYDLYPEPLLLYNLGRAQEGLADPHGAIESYERYLKEAKQVDDRGAIERRIATLKAQIEKQEADAARQADNEKHLAEEREAHEREARERMRLEAAQRAQEPIDDRTPVEKYGPWSTMGLGGALIGTGVVLGIRSGSKHDDAIAAPGQRDAADLQASAHTYATAANVLFVIGGIAAAGGIAWKVWQWKHPHEKAAASLQITPTGAAVEWVFP